jgi:hypothetical protein
MSLLKNKPLTKLSDPFIKGKWSQKNRKQFFMRFFYILGPFGHPQMDPKRYLKAQKWAGGMAQCLSLKISP